MEKIDNIWMVKMIEYLGLTLDFIFTNFIKQYLLGFRIFRTAFVSVLMFMALNTSLYLPRPIFEMIS